MFFGGDPRRVTLYGHGAGAVAAQLHTLSPMSTGNVAMYIELTDTFFQDLSQYEWRLYVNCDSNCFRLI